MSTVVSQLTKCAEHQRRTVRPDPPAKVERGAARHPALRERTPAVVVARHEGVHPAIDHVIDRATGGGGEADAEQGEHGGIERQRPRARETHSDQGGECEHRDHARLGELEVLLPERRCAEYGGVFAQVCTSSLSVSWGARRAGHMVHSDAGEQQENGACVVSHRERDRQADQDVRDTEGRLCDRHDQQHCAATLRRPAPAETKIRTVSAIT